MTGGMNNLGFRMVEDIQAVVSDMLVPFVELYRIPVILLGVAVFVVVWALVGWFMKGRA